MVWCNLVFEEMENYWKELFRENEEYSEMDIVKEKKIATTTTTLLEDSEKFIQSEKNFINILTSLIIANTTRDINPIKRVDTHYLRPMK
ncbi:2375_t:CDS:2 [Diversispora eburnea]|uniref:2375_t:CDS:1 n=1 Tax=Diversispora eburnea TaxID=1213867 RepID=A0A9N9AA96_9GLOM|nr:2375_t:CDS:2 [Diversispora eburnea]